MLSAGADRRRGVPGQGAFACQAHGSIRARSSRPGSTRNVPVQFPAVVGVPPFAGCDPRHRRGRVYPAPANPDTRLRRLAKGRERCARDAGGDETRGGEHLEGKDLLFKFGDFKVPFVAEDFVLSFSLPNLHFHATTAYDILRMKGVPLGKRDYTGPMRIKR